MSMRIARKTTNTSVKPFTFGRLVCNNERIMNHFKILTGWS